MPRKSAASLTVVPVAARQATRLPAPADLTDRQRKLWRETTAPLPADFFSRDQASLLRSFVVHADLAETLTRTLATMEPTTADWARVSAAQVSQSKSMLAFARALRLTSQARVQPDTAGRAVAREQARPAGPRPWEPAA